MNRCSRCSSRACCADAAQGAGDHAQEGREQIEMPEYIAEQDARSHAKVMDGLMPPHRRRVPAITQPLIDYRAGEVVSSLLLGGGKKVRTASMMKICPVPGIRWRYVWNDERDVPKQMMDMS